MTKRARGVVARRSAERAKTSTWPLVPAASRAAHDICSADPSAPYREWTYGVSAIGFVLSGCFEYESAIGSRMGTPGSIVFGNAGDDFRVRHLDQRGNRRLVVHLRQDILSHAAEAGGLGDERFRIAVLPPTKMTSTMFGWMRRIALGLPGEEELLGLLVGAALEHTQERQHLLSVSDRDRRAVLESVRYMESNFAEPCTLAALSALTGLSRYHFVRQFHAIVGQSPIQYLIGLRLRAAAERLLTSAAPITQIALDAGFNDISHFYQCFGLTFGCAPRRWRAANRSFPAH